MYLKNLQNRLIPIYNVTRKGIPFEWTEEQKAFEEIKDLSNIMVMSHYKVGHFSLVSDTSDSAC